MFEPKSHWEKRVALMEGALMQLAAAFGAEQVLGAWHQQREALKTDILDEVLGPQNPDETVHAMGNWAAETLYKQLGAAGLLNFIMQKVELTEEQQREIVEKASHRVSLLPDLDDALGRIAEFQSGLYKIANSQGGHAPAYVVLDAGFLHFFILDGGFTFMSLSLKHMPAQFRWEDADHRQMWRMELFQYRENLNREAFFAPLASSMAAAWALINADIEATAAAAVAEAAADPAANDAEAAVADAVAVEAANDEVPTGDLPTDPESDQIADLGEPTTSAEVAAAVAASDELPQ